MTSGFGWASARGRRNRGEGEAGVREEREGRGARPPVLGRGKGRRGVRRWAGRGNVAHGRLRLISLLFYFPIFISNLIQIQIKSNLNSNLILK